MQGTKRYQKRGNVGECIATYLGNHGTHPSTHLLADSQAGRRSGTPTHAGGKTSRADRSPDTSLGPERCIIDKHISHRAPTDPQCVSTNLSNARST